jgi:hypothetical protein
VFRPVFLAVLFFAVMPKIVTANSFVSIDGEYSYGKYGTDITDSLYQITATVGSISPISDVSLSASWLRLSSDDNLSAASIGDTYLRGGHELVAFTSQDITVYASASLKIPTADESKALGTGEVDYGALLAVKKRWSNFKASIYGGYTVIGDSTDIDYINSKTYGVSIFTLFNRVGMYLDLEGSTATFDGDANPLQLNIGAIYVASIQTFVPVRCAFGLSDGSPDFAVSVGYSRLF